MSYAIAGFSAILSSLCYSEHAVEFPVAGGSFTFILHTFGELWAWYVHTRYTVALGSRQVACNECARCREYGADVEWRLRNASVDWN